MDKGSACITPFTVTWTEIVFGLQNKGKNAEYTILVKSVKVLTEYFLVMYERSSSSTSTFPVSYFA